ncbi:hypothetical protein AK830_g3343 [Neonectria ditissima]|uniref:Transcriptional activator of proteases prtT n=1 Tax=Neonectria ditissima TaxID=78410 RepID=A0A0P7AZR0_9HYPO|nr:hypothetical protein AK830_g3343 [Neonectria ditissima]
MPLSQNRTPHEELDGAEFSHQSHFGNLGNTDIALPASETAAGKKRRRRILSCETCRKIKCRCEYEQGSQICSRCRSLRITCLKPGDDAPAGQNSDASTCQDVDQRTTQADNVRFIQRHTNFIQIEDARELAEQGKTLQDSSPFLHAVLCLHAMKSSPHGHPYEHLHRQVYEKVRSMLGQVVLATPLRMQELLGTLIMSVFASSPTQGPEYIDSWHLTSICAQQFMLSTELSEIVNRVSSQSSLVDDQRTMRTWANVCLGHLHWATATGRHSVIPEEYILQSKVLLSFARATISDAVLYAQILLFSDFLACNSSCQDGHFAQWKKDWGYLWDLPAAGMMKLGYHIAPLILAQRRVQDLHCEIHDALPISLQLDINPPTAASSRGKDLGPPDSSHKVKAETLRNRVTSLAIKLLQEFLEEASRSTDRYPDFCLVAITYAIHLIQQHTDMPYQPPEKEKLLEDLVRIQAMCASGTLSKQISVLVEGAIRTVQGKVSSTQHLKVPWLENNVTLARLDEPHVDRDSRLEVLRQGSQTRKNPNDKEAGQTQAASQSPEAMFMNITWEMESFFSGGYLDMAQIWNGE